MRIHDVLDRRSIRLDAAPTSKQEAINLLVDLMAQSGCLNDVDQYRKDVFAREEQSSTGLGEGIALPHAKSIAVERPALASMIVPKGVDFDAFDEEPAFLLFMIASPINASNDHLDVLARLSTLLMDTQFRDELLAAKSIDEYLAVIDRAEERADERDAERAAEEAADEDDDSASNAEANDIGSEHVTPDAANSSQNNSENVTSDNVAQANAQDSNATNINAGNVGNAGQASANSPNSAANASAVAAAGSSAAAGAAPSSASETGGAGKAGGASANSAETGTAKKSSGTAEPKKKKKVYDLVAVTACPAGLSHTFMAAEALEQKAKEMGVTIKVEADGAAGNRNSLLPEDIAAAKAVIVAADRAVEIDRFMGKRMVRTGVVDGVHRPEMLIKKALDPNCPIFKGGTSLSESSNLPMRMYRHLMSGLTYILPLAATAGILSAVARLDLLNTYSANLGLFLDTIGYSIGILLFPVLSAFIAFSMAGRTGLVAGFTGGVMADMAGASIFGAVLNGFVGGGVAMLISRCAQRFLKGHDAMFALLVYPLAGAVLTTLIAQFITNLPAGLLGNAITNFITGANMLTLALIGAVLGGMMSADMGGPFNKLAYAMGVLLLADCIPENGPGMMVMGSVMLGGMVPPIAAGVAAKFIAPKRFSVKEKSLAWGAIIKGCLFITEGVLPFLKAAPRLRIACVVGSAISGGLSMFFNCGVVAPHGGVFIILLAIHPLHYLLALVVGSLVGAILFALLHPHAKITAVSSTANAVSPASAVGLSAAPATATSAQAAATPAQGSTPAQVAQPASAAPADPAAQPAQPAQSAQAVPAAKEPQVQAKTDSAVLSNAANPSNAAKVAVS